MWDISVHATYIELRALGTYTTYDYGPWFKIGLSPIIQFLRLRERLILVPPVLS